MKNPSSLLRRRTRNVTLCLLFSILVWIGWTWARSRQLIANGREIGIAAQKFPRDYRVGNPSSPLFTYVAMGDSTAAGWGANDTAGTYPYRIAQTIAARGYSVRVFNVAVGGARLDDVTRYQLAQLQRVKPDLISVSVGANDATHATNPNDYRRNYKTLLSALQNSSARTVLLANAPDMYQVPALPLPAAMVVNRRAQGLNRVFEGEMASSTKLRVVNLYGRGKLIYRQNPNLYAADFFHPSGAGYEIWAKAFVDELGTL